jgi:hypothetical protein
MYDDNDNDALIVYNDKFKNDSKIIVEDIASKRKLTTSKRWSKYLSEKEKMDENFELLILELILKEEKGSQEPGDDARYVDTKKMMRSEILKKICSYRSQDKIHFRSASLPIIGFISTIELLLASQLGCFYCKKRVSMIYANVLEPYQWTLERMKNNIGHKLDNVVVSCLKCNLRRRIMKPERYILTKQMTNVIKLAGPTSEFMKASL